MEKLGLNILIPIKRKIGILTFPKAENLAKMLN